MDECRNYSGSEGGGGGGGGERGRGERERVVWEEANMGHTWGKAEGKSSFKILFGFQLLSKISFSSQAHHHPGFFILCQVMCAPSGKALVDNCA